MKTKTINSLTETILNTQIKIQVREEAKILADFGVSDDKINNYINDAKSSSKDMLSVDTRKISNKIHRAFRQLRTEALS